MNVRENLVASLRARTKEVNNNTKTFSVSLYLPYVSITWSSPAFLTQRSGTFPALFTVDQALRTVPTKYKGFCARLGPRGKSRSLQGLLESTKKNMGNHAFFRDN